MARNPYKAILTPEEAMRAIYIDFEGRKDEPPALLGSLYFEGRSVPDPDRLVLRHDILDPTLQPLAGKIAVPGLYLYDCRRKSLAQSIHDIVRRAKNQKRPIVAWSHHEIRKIEEAELSSYLARNVDRWFRDGKATARRWRLTLEPGWQLERDASGRADRLTHYLDRIGYDVPEEYRGGKVGETLKLVRASLTAGREWEGMTKSQQKRWTDLLMHNFLDCDGLREVTQRAATELAQELEPQAGLLRA